jgi:transposase
MEQYAGLDVSLESTSVCVVDTTGRVIRETKVLSEPEALIGWFQEHGTPMTRIGLEAGPLSQWLYAAMESAELPVELLETRHVRAAFKAMTIGGDKILMSSPRGHKRRKVFSAQPRKRSSFIRTILSR